MHDDAPGLFELESEVSPPKVPVGRGRRREKWRATTTATVVVRDPQSIRNALEEAEPNTHILAASDGSAAEQANELEKLGPLDQLAWLVWPTDGLDDAMELDAFQIREIEAQIAGDQGNRGTLRWSVTVVLHDVTALRRLASKNPAGTDNHAGDSFEDVWFRAIDPYAPIRSIPGIEWQEGGTDLTYLPARPNR